MNLVFGDVYQDATWVVSQVVSVTRVAAYDRFVQRNFLVVGTIRNCHIDALRRIIMKFVEVIDHKPVRSSSGRYESPNHAVIVSPHRVVLMGGRMALR